MNCLRNLWCRLFHRHERVVVFQYGYTTERGVRACWYCNRCRRART